MESTALLGQWATAASVLHQARTPLVTTGPRDEPFPWASVSKLAVAAVVGCAVQRGEMQFDDLLGPEGATLAHVLSHSSGLGPTREALGARVGIKRIYSTFGYELIVERLGGVAAFVEQCHDVLTMTSVASDGTAGGGLVGSLEDLESLAWTWLGHGALTELSVQQMTTTFLPDLGGVVPGFGSFQPCPWALGPQVKGASEHWMGARWPAGSFGHFGQSGSLVLIDHERDFAVVALSSREFGPWAVSTWPTWTSEMYELGR